eukprot:TRINITY_DN57860_c0_g1_i1.p2 TRINITY_DN57860_c0_g1~~TRINITY_DN57860_c0_g1_i1.p2  ORF type:complete len:150 (+),score=17.21 TRINITY_DN57860_c0_g1_i1:60-509(+)
MDPALWSDRSGQATGGQVESLLETIEHDYAKGLLDEVAGKFRTPCVCSIRTPLEQVGTIQQTPDAVERFFEFLRHEFRCKRMRFSTTSVANDKHAREIGSAGGIATVGCCKDEDGDWRITHFDIDCSQKSANSSMPPCYKTMFLSVVVR